MQERKNYLELIGLTQEQYENAKVTVEDFILLDAGVYPCTITKAYFVDSAQQDSQASFFKWEAIVKTNDGEKRFYESQNIVNSNGEVNHIGQKIANKTLIELCKAGQIDSVELEEMQMENFTDKSSFTVMSLSKQLFASQNIVACIKKYATRDGSSGHNKVFKFLNLDDKENLERFEKIIAKKPVEIIADKHVKADTKDTDSDKTENAKALSGRI